MTKEIFFLETQKFRQWWAWIILLGVNGLFLFGVYKQVINGEAFGDKQMSNEGLLVTSALTLLFTVLFFNLRLETAVKKDGIYVRFFPFHIKFKHYDWNTLTKSYVRQYSPLMEYGGWGLKLGLFGKGTAFNVSGDQGLQLEFTNDRKLLIGTNKAEELSEVLSQIGQLKH